MRNIKKFTDSILKYLTVILLAFVIAFTGTACKDKNSGNPPVNPPGGVVDDPSIEKEECQQVFSFSFNFFKSIKKGGGRRHCSLGK